MPLRHDVAAAVLLAPLAVFHPGCAGDASAPAAGGPSVRVEADPSKDYTRYKTYGWLPGQLAAQPGTGVPSEKEVEQRVRAVLEPRLAAEGLEPAGNADPDLWVTYYASVRRNAEVVPSARRREVSGYDEPGGIPQGGEWGVREFDEGSLTVRFTDARTKEVVWMARVGADVTAGARPLAKAMDEALKKYPPKKK